MCSNSLVDWGEVVRHHLINLHTLAALHVLPENVRWTGGTRGDTMRGVVDRQTPVQILYQYL